jgi:hypothetical protein
MTDKRSRYRLSLISGIAALLPLTVTAGEVDVIDARASCQGQTCSFSATLRHGDTGWSHYADHWRVLDAEGNELGRRVLLHPHVDEQPFTRSLGNVQIPGGLNQVTIQAHDKVHGYGGKEFKLELGTRN